MTPSAGRTRLDSSAVEALVPQILERMPRALARAISLVEAGEESGRELIGHLHSRRTQARTIGVTGPPGAGKSTLVDDLTRLFRKREMSVAVITVDPSSPFSGGALLGDRIRMQDHSTDPDVFIRSMATRGATGGLARATADAVDVLDAAGFDIILVETVGVGQDEIDVIRTVETVLVVTLPGLGDGIQAIKAGILEIGDVFVVNKADRPGLERAVRDLETMLDMNEDQVWRPPIVATVAHRGEGVETVREELERHTSHLRESGEGERRRFDRLLFRVESILEQRLLATIHERDLEQELRRAVVVGEDPYRLAERLLATASSAWEGEDG